MMTNRRHGTLYVGVTADLITRVVQHMDGEIAGFSATHGLKRLVWFEPHDTIVGAIQREKALKKYKREWKINLIEDDKSAMGGSASGPFVGAAGKPMSGRARARPRLPSACNG
jgi:putative endonuclease